MLQDRHGDATILTPAGRLDSQSASAFRDRLEGVDATGRLVMDLAGVDYISSAGLAVLLWLAKRMRDAGGRLALCGVAPPVRRVLELAGYIQYFTVAATRDEAAALVGGEPR